MARAKPIHLVLTVDQAAEIVGKSVRRVRQLCASGELTARQIGREWIIDRASAEQWQPKPAGRPAKAS